jgi:hypothetical protein|tara:strand:+ start:887 stop:1132 length:246 start_codon:yes stop_codon:yes gene_type:complete
MKAVRLTVALKIDQAENFTNGPVARVDREVTRHFASRAEALQFLGEMQSEASQELSDATHVYGELDSLRDDKNRVFGGTLK